MIGAAPFERRSGLLLLLAAVLLWLLCHPITTFWHDARLYAVQALYHLDHDAYARDPFFMFGSQDDYSLFSRLYAPLIEHFGLRAAHTVVMAAGGLLWCFAAIRVAHGCMPHTWLAGAAALALAALSVNYSPNGNTFVLNENYATARTLAFPLGALALAECVRGFWLRGLFFSVGATLLHPLLGIWPLALTILWPLSWRWRWYLAGTALTITFLLMLAELGPFVRFDAAWETHARLSPDVFVWPLVGTKTMRWHDYSFELLALLMAAWHARDSAPKAARLYALSVMVATCGLLTAMAASWWWPSQLVIQSQLWRGMWLVAYMLPVALTHMLWLLVNGLWPLDDGRPWWLLAVIVLLLILREQPLLVVLVAWGIFAGRYILRSLYPSESQRGFPRLAAIQNQRWFPSLVIVLLLISVPALWRDFWIQGLATPLNHKFIMPELVGIFVGGGFGIGFVLIAWGCFRYGRHMAVLWISGTLLTCALWNWDIRYPNVKKWEASASFGLDVGIGNLIHSGDVVLWASNRMPLETWYDLRTAHYAGAEQATGLVFSREKTFELIARAQRIRAARAAEQHDDDKPWTGSSNAFSFAIPEGNGIPLLCQDLMLDWVIVPMKKNPFPGGYEFTHGERKWMAYRCSSFRGLGL
jgi:hypothetical protein